MATFRLRRGSIEPWVIEPNAGGNAAPLPVADALHSARLAQNSHALSDFCRATIAIDNSGVRVSFFVHVRGLQGQRH